MPFALRTRETSSVSSGFTALSEKFAQEGERGIENFSLAINETFDKILTVTGKYNGDIECFAGDALLVLFRAKEDQESSSWAQQESIIHMPALLGAAFCCGAELCSLVSPILVDVGETQSQLALHGAVAFGQLTSLIVGETHLFSCQCTGPRFKIEIRTSVFV